MKRLPPTRRQQHTDLGVVAALLTAVALLISPSAFTGPTWNFAVSGDSLNCGDVVTPSIAAAARANQVSFYWHLGDLPRHL